MRYQDYGGFRPQLIYGAVSHGVGSKLFWTTLYTRRCRHLRQNGNENGQLRLFGVGFRNPLPFSSKNSVLLAHTLGGSRTARVKIVLVKKQGGNLARKESTRRVEIVPAVPNASSQQQTADRL